MPPRPAPAAAPFAVTWDELRQRDWDELLARAERPGLEQAWAYGDGAAAEGQRVRRGLLRELGRPVGLLQLCERRLAGVFGLAQVLRGPVWITPPADSALLALRLIAWREAMKAERRRVLLWMPDLPAGPESVGLMKALRMRPVLTGYPTLWVDLRPGTEALRARLHGKWRHDLVRAEKAGMAVTLDHTGGQFDALVGRYALLQKKHRFGGPPPGLIVAYAKAVRRKQEVLALTATAAGSGEPVAGVLLLAHGRAATYVAGWADTQGRRLEATNLLLWRGLIEAKVRGIDWLDLGGLDTAAAPGIARFKLGLGGQLVTLAGTFA